MQPLKSTILFLFITFVAAVPPFDPAGAKNVGNNKGIQFIGGQCLSNQDCASGCCANPTGICSGPGASTQNGKTGCGFGSSGSSSAASAASSSLTPSSVVDISTLSTVPANGGPAFDPAGFKNVGNAQGLQFIGGQCLSTADCASGCCAGPSGICSGPEASTQNGKTGCGFPDSGSSSSAVSSSTPAATKPDSEAAATTEAAAPAASHGGPPFDPAGEKNVGNAKGLQFIGGQCLSTADCASGCCAGPSGICSGPGASTQAGKTGCGFQSRKRLLKV